jgi:ABC-2 type transport system permease protein
VSAPLTGRQAVLLVARREFVTQVRSRAFLLGIVITLVLFAAVGGISVFISAQNSENSLGVTADTAALVPALEATAGLQDIELTITEVDDAAGRAQVEADELDALLTGSAGGYELLGRDSVSGDLQSVVTTAVQQQALNEALTGAGIDPAGLAAQSEVSVATIEPADPNRGQQLGVAIVGTVLLFISLNYAQAVASGVVEEKQSRVVELLLATIKPQDLLAGKVLGLGAVGLLNLLILGAIGAVAGVASGMLTVPGAAGGMFVMVIVWYLIGFFLFAAIYAAIGSTVSRQEELQSVLAPMVFVLIIPFILTLNLLPNDPRNGLAAVLSFVPLFSQTVMPARYALGAAPLWQVAVSALIAVAAIFAVVRVAARVYQNSILRTGARVSLREAIRAR